MMLPVDHKQEVGCPGKNIEIPVIGKSHGMCLWVVYKPFTAIFMLINTPLSEICGNPSPIHTVK